MNDQPLLFLDVDGVLNCLNFDADYHVLRADPDDPFGLIATVPPGMPARITALLEQFEPVWSSSFDGGRVHELFREHLNLTAEPWGSLSFQGLKLPAIVEHAAGRPWAWVDDMARSELRSCDISAERCLVICPNPKTGLDDGHVEQLLQFAAELTASPTA